MVSVMSSLAVKDPNLFVRPRISSSMGSALLQNLVTLPRDAHDLRTRVGAEAMGPALTTVKLSSDQVSRP